MKIEKLTVKNFRSHEATMVALDRFNFVVGPNASGKSSIAMAIEFLLTGRCQATDSAGRGADDLIQIGARELYVAGSVGGKLIERTKGPKNHILDIGGKSGPLAPMQAKIYEILGTSSDVLSAVLNSSRFTSMDEKSQKQLLAQVLASDAIEIPGDVRQAMTDLGFCMEIDSIADIDGACKVFYDQRSDVNREIKGLGTVNEPDIQAGTPDYKTTWKRLDDLRNELAIATSGNVRAEERLAAAVAAVSQKRTDLTARAAEAKKRILGDGEAAELTRIIDGQSKAERIGERARQIRESIAKEEQKFQSNKAAQVATATQFAQAIRDDISERQNLVGVLSKIKGADCPTCLRALTSKDKAALGDRLVNEVAEYRQSLTLAEKNIEIARAVEMGDETIGPLKKELARVEFEISELGNAPEAEARMRVHREAIVEVTRCDRELAALTEPQPVDNGSASDKIKELSERIGKGEAILERVRAIESSREAYVAWKQKKESLEASVAVLERLIEFFGPNGIKAQMVGDKMGPFYEAMNAALSSFGYVCSFTLEPYEFRVHSIEAAPGDHGRNLKQLSDSELFRFGVAFQIALAMATGLKFVVIDRADVLDTPSRSALTGMLLGSDLDQAIVLSTTDKAAPESLPAGVKFVQLGAQSVAA